MAGSSVRRYVGQKVNVVRWKPPPTHYRDTDSFVAATWDDDENTIGVWHIAESEDDPVLISHLSHQGDISDIQYVTQDSFVVGSSTGVLRLYRHATGGHLELASLWDKVHSFTTGPAPCTSLACSGDQIASVGEDGKLVILNPNKKKLVRVLEGVGGCSLYAVMFVRTHEVLTSSMQGHLKLWDLRASQPAKGLLFSPDQVAVCHLAGHPTQQHLVAAGGEDGTLALWDMRNTSHPFTVIAAHGGPICQVQFHPLAPEHLFTCGLDGQLLHWDASNSARSSHLSYKGNQEVPGGSVTVWLGSEVSRGITDTTCILQSPLPINSLDVKGSTLIAGSDNEAIYVVRQVLKKSLEDVVY